MTKKPITTLEELAQFIEKLPPAGFDMTYGFSYEIYETYMDGQPEDFAECGSPMCIGGWAMGLADMMGVESMAYAIGALKRENGEIVSELEARHLCNLTPRTDEIERRVNRATPAQAALAIRILDADGFCDWERALEMEDA